MSASEDAELVEVIPPPAPAGPRYNRWSFTVNLSLDEHANDDGLGHHWEPPAVRIDGFRFLIAGLEVCPDTGRLHWQCYCEVYEKSSMKSVKRALRCGWAHLESSYAAGDLNVEYCSKDAIDVVTWGVAAGCKGARTDIALLTQAIKANKSEFDVWNEFSEMYLKYHKGVQAAIALEAHRHVEEQRPVKCWLRWGVTGSGKTHKFFAKAPGLYNKPLGAKDVGWWDNYVGQEFILLDDFSGQIDIDELKRILDIYPYQCSQRGRTPVPARWLGVFITSQHPIAEWCALLLLASIDRCVGGGGGQSQWIWQRSCAASPRGGRSTTGRSTNRPATRRVRGRTR